VSPPLAQRGESLQVSREGGRGGGGGGGGGGVDSGNLHGLVAAGRKEVWYGLEIRDILWRVLGEMVGRSYGWVGSR